MTQGGYVNCACRDCFEIAISGAGEPTLCNECEDAGCGPEGTDGEGECLAPDAYGVDCADESEAR